jgi:arylsulfatase A
MTLEKMRDPANKKDNWVPLMEGDAVVEYPADQSTLTRRYTERCVSFIKTHRDEPFFLYMAHTFPHIPLFASDAFRGKSDRGLYGDAVEELDAAVGTILQTLRDLDLDENTLVVFTSDNGPWLLMNEDGGSAGLLRGGKNQTWEGGMREPTIVWWPGHIQAGGVVHELGSTLDIYKTFCTLANVQPPARGPVDSYDLSSVLLGKGTSPRDVLFYYRGAEIYAVRQGPWKAHFITEGSYGQGEKKTRHDPPLLYHLEHDPSEKYNVAEKHPDVVQRLQQLAGKQAAEVKPAPSRYKKRLD